MLEHRCGPSRKLENSFVGEEAPKRLKWVSTHNNKFSVFWRKEGSGAVGLLGRSRAVPVLPEDT